MTERKYRAFDANGRAIGITFGRNEKHYDRETRSYLSLEEIGYTAYMTKEQGCIRIFAKGITVYAREKSDGGIMLSQKVRTNGYTEDSATFVQDKAKGNYSAIKKYLLNVHNFKEMKFSTLMTNLVEGLRDKYEAEQAQAVKRAAC